MVHSQSNIHQIICWKKIDDSLTPFNSLEIFLLTNSIGQEMLLTNVGLLLLSTILIAFKCSDENNWIVN